MSLEPEWITRLEAAFRATRYCVTVGAQRLDLRIGEFDPVGDAILERQGATCWAVLTAYNPGGVLGDEAVNAPRQVRLLDRLWAMRRAHWPAVNIADGGAWPVEPAVLAWPLDEPEAVRLAAEFGQLACVCGRTGEAPRLVWTADGSSFQKMELQSPLPSSRHRQGKPS